MSQQQVGSSGRSSRAPRTSFKFGVASTFPGPLPPAHCNGHATSGPKQEPDMTWKEEPDAAADRHGTCRRDDRAPLPASIITISSGDRTTSSLSSSRSSSSSQPGQDEQRSDHAQAPQPAATSPATATGSDAYTIPPRLQDSADLASVLAALDESQKAAVCFDPSTPLLIQAGAGSGKTQTMASRIAFLLLCGVPPRRILGICFTRQAAETLRQRVRAVLPASLQPGVGLLTLKTLHSFGLQCLRRFGVMAIDTEVFDAAKQRKLARRIVEQHAVHNKSADAVEQLVEYVNKAKMKKDLPAAQFSPNVQDGYLFRFYEAALHEEEKAVDFGDLQRMFFDILRPVRDSSAGESGGDPMPLRLSGACEALRRDYSHVVVDEFQDFNEIQFEILAYLAGDACRVTCVGDPNQCIYEWRGAMSNVFQAWRGRFPQTELRVLQVNYRSDGEIVSALNGLVSSHQHPHYHRADRKITLIRCESDDTVPDVVPFVIEKIFKMRGGNVRYSDMAVLCRSRRRVQVMCDALRHKNIPVKELKGVAPDGISIVRALLAYLKLAVRPDLDDEVRTALSAGPRYLPVRPCRSLFFGLAAMAAERRQRASGAARESEPGGPLPPSPSSSLLCSPAGAPISPFSFYALLTEAAFHDFSEEAYPKLKGPSKAQHKTIKHFIKVIREAHDRLYRPPNCDVADLIRTVAREGGFESENPVTVDGGAPSVAAATGRKRRRGASDGPSSSPAAAPKSARRGRASGALAADVAADFSTAPDSPESFAQREETLARRLAKLPRSTEADDGQQPPYTAEEEAALLATTRVSVTELLLCAYEDVMEEARREEQEEEEDRGATGAGGANRAAPPPPATPAAILRRVLDQFVTLLPSDDFGSLNTLSTGAGGGAPASLSASVCAAPIKDEGEEEEKKAGGHGRAQPQRYPHGHLQSTTVDKVTVSTVHRAKGMEWASVVIPDCWVGEFPTRSQDREERRVFYVAMSRAMTNLVLITARTSDDPRYTRKGESQSGSSTNARHHQPQQQQEPAKGALVETPYLAQMRGREMEEEEFEALRLAMMQARGAW